MTRDELEHRISLGCRALRDRLNEVENNQCDLTPQQLDELQHTLKAAAEVLSSVPISQHVHVEPKVITLGERQQVDSAFDRVPELEARSVSDDDEDPHAVGHPWN